MEKKNIRTHAKIIKARELVNPNRLQEARLAYKEICMIDNRDAISLFELGVVNIKLGLFEEAAGYLKESIILNPNNLLAHHNLGEIRSRQARFDDAITCFKRALLLNQEVPFTHSSIGFALNKIGAVDSALSHYREAIRLSPASHTDHSNLLLYLHNSTRYDAFELFLEHKKWAEQHTSGIAQLTGHSNSKDPERKLRIGYISPDIHKHSVSYFFEPLLANHDREKFQVYVYANNEMFDEVTERIKASAYCFKPVAGFSDDQLAELVIQDAIDILVDLAGHTAGNRLLVFARKPAPIQITYLGYPNTTGLSSMDYRITDELADPPGKSEHLYSEVLLRLPNCFITYLPPENSPEVAATPARRNGFITFGTFNSISKITPSVVDIWAKLLQAVNGSHMVLKNRSMDNMATRERYRKLFIESGIENERVTFIGSQEKSFDHLDVYNTIDISLDPFPYNGTRTTCESLWMGVPVITLACEAHVGRVGVSILNQLGLQDFVASNLDEYTAKASSLAGDLDNLDSIRLNLRSRMAQSSLCDGRAFASNLEHAFRTIWHDWCAGTTKA